MALAAGLPITGAATATTSNKAERFTLINSSTNNPELFSAIARADFTAGGTAIVVKGKATLQFPAGTITVKITRGHSNLVKVDTP